jgi:hypothetical protein
MMEQRFRCIEYLTIRARRVLRSANEKRKHINNSSRAKFFFDNTIFLAKTCCTNTTILYNYEQVDLKSDLSFTC